MVPGGSRRLQNDCDPTASGRVGSIPMHSRQLASSRPSTPVRHVPPQRRMRSCRLLTVVVVLAAVLAAPRAAAAQRLDSARVAPRAAVVDSSIRVIVGSPLSPRRAFLYSLALPGYGQSILGRPTAGAIFAVAEIIGITMLREANAELRQARQLRSDSLTVIGYDPATGARITARSPFTDELIDLRRGHREDWVAALLANHFFAGADAYVAAHLWDLPAQVALRQTEQGTMLSARVHW